ncbi:unnamed protein product [Cylindrotheca closterium]|uniref:Uncharacterized protein n=1 Tax=Cylindrotheca closterium TaxID=2856 RepID=A0AAD2GAB9_9STRA|nr:unnamed protein product [Cylindrotheca closterium]
MSNSDKQSNKFAWSHYEAIDLKGKGRQETFTIRHLKQGSTGAVSTWPVASVLLDYLVLRNGLARKVPSVDTLNMADNSLQQQESTDPLAANDDNESYNIVELGAGTGYLGIGLALSLNREANLSSKEDGVRFQPKVRVMCTDNDQRTIKNMRFNVMDQPKEGMLSKAVTVQNLAWGTDVGGTKFSNAIGSQFGSRQKNKSEKEEKEEDPLRLVTHLIASDVHYGVTTLDPLSSVISAFKLRNPNVVVIVLLKERSPEVYADVTGLKAEIESKVQSGLGDKECSLDTQTALKDFFVSVRDVIHHDITNMKMVEC